MNIKTIIYILIALFLLGNLLHFSNRSQQEKMDDCQEYDLVGSRCLP